jgi:hypothetical protein
MIGELDARCERLRKSLRIRLRVPLEARVEVR